MDESLQIFTDNLSTQKIITCQSGSHKIFTCNEYSDLSRGCHIVEVHIPMVAEVNNTLYFSKFGTNFIIAVYKFQPFYGRILLPERKIYHEKQYNKLINDTTVEQWYYISYDEKYSGGYYEIKSEQEFLDMLPAFNNFTVTHEYIGLDNKKHQYEPIVVSIDTDKIKNMLVNTPKILEIKKTMQNRIDGIL